MIHQIDGSDQTCTHWRSGLLPDRRIVRPILSRSLVFCFLVVLPPPTSHAATPRGRLESETPAKAIGLIEEEEEKREGRRIDRQVSSFLPPSPEVPLDGESSRHFVSLINYQRRCRFLDRWVSAEARTSDVAPSPMMLMTRRSPPRAPLLRVKP